MAVDVRNADVGVVHDRSQSVSVSSAIVAMVEKARHGVVEVRGRGRGAGAGIICSDDGKIITNYHVVAGAGGSPQVQLYDGTCLESKSIAENPALDLALLQIDADQLPALPIGNSANLRIGELVFAFGHPWGHKHVVTAGVVSGLGRIEGGDRGRSADYLRSDVRLAPGNSGGPLVNANGEVVGVNSMIFGGDLSVAIPSHVVLDWLGRAGERVYLGVAVRPTRISPSRGDERPTTGVVVIAVDPKGPAARAGVRVGDIVLAVAGQAVTDTASLKRALAQGVADNRTDLTLWRGGQTFSLSVPLTDVE